MYQCICGYKGLTKEGMRRHMSGCMLVRSKVAERGFSTFDINALLYNSMIFDMYCSDTTSKSYTSSDDSSSFTPGGGEFDGGGASYSYDSTPSSSSYDSSSSSSSYDSGSSYSSCSDSSSSSCDSSW